MLALIGLMASFTAVSLTPVWAGTVTPFAKIQGKHAQVELLSRETAVAPGRDALVGVRFVLEPGWHIYWVNPGDSGQPPVFQWQLPAGFVAGDIQWPHPERMQNTSALADYGYHNEVLLAVPIHVAPSAAGPAAITLDARWLICREVCLPDGAQLRISIPVAARATADASTASIFAATEKSLPKPFPAHWKAIAFSSKDAFVLSLETGHKLDKVQFFPLDADQIENAAAQQLEPTAGGAQITLKKSDQMLKAISVLRGIVVLPAGDSYRVDVPVRSGKNRIVTTTRRQK